MWFVVVQEFVCKYGLMFGNGVVVLGMGLLGVGWFYVGLDFDLIMIYDDDGVDVSDGLCFL